MLDYNAFVGAWPFYKLPRTTLEELRELHREHGISGGFVSSISSIFYNDFYESERELSELLRGTEYKQVVTVNPTLPECPLTLARCIRDFDVCAIRLVPGYHGYSLNSDAVAPVLKLAREKGLPIFVTARMIDERLTHLMHPPLIDGSELVTFIKNNPDIKILLCHFKIGEIAAIRETLLGAENVYTDISGFRNNLFEEDFTEIFTKAVYGSAYPLYPVAAGVMLVNNELKDEKILRDFRERVL